MTALDRGNNDFGQVGYKFNMRAKLREVTEGYEEKDIYSVATLLDPRYKDGYFMDVNTAEQAKSALLRYVEAEIQPEEMEPVMRDSVTEPAPEAVDSSLSILGQINKRIRLERQQKVRTSLKFKCAPLKLIYFYSSINN